jgi:hypothetical protein
MYKIYITFVEKYKPMVKETDKVLHLHVNKEVLKKFKSKCVDRGETMTARLNLILRQDVESK